MRPVLLPMMTYTAMNKHQEKKAVAQVLAFAKGIGAARVKSVAPDKICVEEKLAALCHDPKCPFWGQSMSCPPYVTGPAGFRKLLASCRHAIVFRFEVQACSLQGEERPQVMRLLHEMTAAIEIRAKELGFTEAAGFAGGSCKASFCADKPFCRVIEQQEECCYPDQARPSMSGYGVNVGSLMEAAGWPGDVFPSRDDQEQMSWVGGLVLLR